MRERSQNYRPGLTRSALVVLKAARDRIVAGGPGWVPNQSGTPLLWKTGRLINSLQLGNDGNATDYIGDDAVKVGTRVPYAKWLQDGTGIYGPTGQPITSKTGKALAFMIGGKKIVRRSVKGSPARPYLFIDDNVAHVVLNVWRTYIMEGVPNGE